MGMWWKKLAVLQIPMDAVYAAIVDLLTLIATAYICKHSSTVRQSFNVPSRSKVS